MCLFKRTVTDSPPAYNVAADARLRANRLLRGLLPLHASGKIFKGTSLTRKAQLKVHELEGALTTARLLRADASIPPRKLVECIQLAAQGLSVEKVELRRLYDVRFRESHTPGAPRDAWVDQTTGMRLQALQQV